MIERVSVNDVLKLRALFKKKNWNNYSNEEYVFESLCKLMDNLSSDQRDLLFELTDDFLWVSAKEYEDRFSTIINQIEGTINLTVCRNIYLIPVIKVKDRKKIKSAPACVYLLKGLLGMNKNFSHIKIEISEDYELLKRKSFKNDGTDLIMLIDDFIGTGDSFGDCWTDLINNKTIQISNSVLVSLVMQSDGFNFIRDKYGIAIYHSEVRNKGISNKYKEPHLSEKTKIMKDMEKYCKAGDFSFGYGQSEALVSMTRTPNNTFPIFWKHSTIRNEKFAPPFPRG